jgi:alkylhydroperoxidase family enzyme
MLEFGEKLTATPGEMTVNDLTGLRRSGFSDREILSITLAAAYRNFITRAADGLGVELRREGAYVSEILRAFGVTEAEVKTTIYGDRQTAREATSLTRPARSSSPSQESTAAVCGIDTAVADEAVFSPAAREFTRLTPPHPLHHLVSAFGMRPDALKASLDFGQRLGMGGSGLGRRLEAIIGLAVAATAWMPYTGGHHAQALLDGGATAREVAALIQDPAGGSLSGPELAVARYCEKLTRNPGTMARSDLESVRQAGFADQDLLIIAASAAFENFLGRVAAGVMVRTEEDLTPEATAPFGLAQGP